MMAGILKRISKTARLSIMALFLSLCCAGLQTQDTQGTQDTQELTLSEALAYARALVGEGYFLEALEVLDVLRPELPDNDDVKFLTGLAALNASQTEGMEPERQRELLKLAILNFHDMLSRQPGLTRVQLELARAFFLNGQDALAKRHFEEVLAGDIHPNVAANVRSFLAVIEARRNWTSYFGFSLAPDTNITNAAPENVIYLFGLPFVRNPEQDIKSGVGLNVWGGGEYQFKINERTRLRLGTDLARTEYPGNIYDSTSISLHVGPRWLLDDVSEISLLGSIKRNISSSGSSTKQAGVRLEYFRRLSDKLTVGMEASIHHQSTTGAPLEKGPINSYSFNFDYLIRPTLKTSLTLGKTKDNPRTLRNTYSQPFGHLSVSWASPIGINLTVGGRYSKTKYKGQWFQFTPGDVPRRDETMEFRVSIHRPGFTLGGFSPRLTGIYTKRNSNAQLQSFSRKRVEMSLVRQF